MQTASDLIDRLMVIVERRIALLEKKKTFTDADVRSIAEWMKILFAIKKNEEDVEQQIKDLLAKIPTDKLEKML